MKSNTYRGSVTPKHSSRKGKEHTVSMKPIIGISGNLLVEKSGPVAGLRRTYINEVYVSAVKKEGGVPVILPVVEEDEIIEEQAKLIDGLILTGGYDVNPHLYGEEPASNILSTWPTRDCYETNLIKCVLKSKKPILGICRGIQILNVVFGGSLYQDVSQINGPVNRHMQATFPEVPTHTIKTAEGSKLRKIVGEKVLMNSLHHQCIKKVADGFKVTAVASDGIVEAIEKEGEVFVMGVQFHPEFLVDKYPYAAAIFEQLILEARAVHIRRATIG